MAVDAAIQHGIDGFVDAWATDEPLEMLAAFLRRSPDTATAEDIRLFQLPR